MVKEMNILITLRAARVCSGYSKEAAAEHMLISTETICEYERDAGKMPLSAAIKILELYRFPLAAIYFGDETEFMENRKRGAH
jgi:DNA-binding XRE family transcriptional regulator